MGSEPFGEPCGSPRSGGDGGQGLEQPHQQLVGGKGTGTAQTRLLFKILLHVYFLLAIIYIIGL